MPYDYVNFSCVVSNSPGLYATLTDCENAVNDGSAKPVLRLSPLWNASKRVSLPLTTSKLGDGYQQTIFQGTGHINEEWDITSPIMSESQVNQLLNQLRRLSASSFLWSPNNGVIPYQEFTCDEWRKTRVGINQYQVATKFKMTILGSGLLISGGGVTPPSSLDPSFSSRLLLLPGNGLNNGTSFVDRSNFNRAISLVGSGVITSTAQSQWGGSSIYFPGTSAYLSTPLTTNINFDNSRNFSIQAWIYRIGNNRYQAIVGNYNLGVAGSGFAFGVSDTNRLFFNVNGATVSIVSSLLVPANTWSYIAMSKSANIYSFVVDQSIQTVNNSLNWQSSNQAIMGIGGSTRSDFLYPLNGYLNDLRISDIADNISSVPTSAFPTS